MRGEKTMQFVEVLWIIVIIAFALMIRWIRILSINSERQIEQNKLIIEKLNELHQTLKDKQN
jgi:hypothetical protein